MDTCDECGFRYDLADAEGAGATVTAGAADLAAVLAGDSAELHRRPEPDVWSPLEYACHVRDVLLVQRERVLAARRTERPSCAPMGRDERVDHDGYADQDPGDVARQLTDAGRLFANVLVRLGPDDWERQLVYNYPAPTDRSLRWVAVHTVHEVRHHLADVRRQVSATTS